MLAALFRVCVALWLRMPASGDDPAATARLHCRASRWSPGTCYAVLAPAPRQQPDQLICGGRQAISAALANSGLYGGRTVEENPEPVYLDGTIAGM